MQEVAIYTDGACRGNPGPGGWGAVIIQANQPQQHVSGADPDTTNNRMELMAAIQALQALSEPMKVDLTTDSVYVRDGITSWLPNWKKRGWKTASNKPVKNKDLWQALDQAAARHDVSWHWVKGHSGHPENELADQLAVQAIDELLTS